MVHPGEAPLDRRRIARLQRTRASGRPVTRSLPLLVLAGVLFAASTVAHAQDAAEPTPADRQAAAEAYDRGTRAFLARDYARAAEFFETAYRLAPNSAALIQAVRSYDRADDDLRAATLALRLQAFHRGERQASREADRALRGAAARFVRVDVTCDGCTLELDGAILGHSSFFLAAGGEHVLRASFSTGVVSRQVSGSAGDTLPLSFEAPPPPPPEITFETTSTSTESDHAGAGPALASEEPPPSSSGLTPVFALVSLGATAIAGGILVWSGVDALDGVSAYEAMPTEQRLADGQDRELRTNVMIGVTAGLGLATVLLLAFTDWDGAPSDAESGATARVLVVPGPDGAAAVLGGRF